ncbi:MAG: Exodeoxyribonuclease VII large subunit [uncultured Corynebacteriales bacterium]|uniref:Exodeoxyribonuclease 7 large subunit n=1 Tax=uncultured Mycobacteriales bacterium TaxID=581187 RepID=A0A6J4HDJ1_9ACTN|nr:MAG: Exodeoxyribonuclease VII large subunit [uncultured Corynebacteriales bacterium]
MTNPTGPETPWPVRTVAMKIAEWVSRLGEVWVEGQVTQVNRRGSATAFLTLRDPAADVSVSVTCRGDVLEGIALAEGARVVVRARPDYYVGRGTLTLRATEVRPVGIGELLARLERLRRILHAEGLFAPERKRPLPFLPGKVGLVTGRASAAERDVLENARRRWPAVSFRVEAVPVQGVTAVPAIVDALHRLDHDRSVDVIVIARGGGSVEDLLPFSDEALIRAVAALRTPVVSAIGHEPDSPLLDLVADVRCSTPTDAGKRVVPDVAEELARIEQLRQRGRRVLGNRVDRSLAELESWRRTGRRIVTHALQVEVSTVDALRSRARRCVTTRLDAAEAALAHSRAQVAALSPAATLQRGYAVVQRADGTVVRDPAGTPAGTALRLRLAGGTLGAVAGDAVAGGSVGPAGAAGSAGSARSAGSAGSARSAGSAGAARSAGSAGESAGVGSAATE